MSYPEEIKEIWELVKQSLRAGCAETVFDLWYGCLTLHGFNAEKNEVIFAVDSEFKYKELPKRHQGIIEEHFAKVVGMEMKVSFVFTGTPVDKEAIIRRFTVKPKEERTAFPQQTPAERMSAEEAQRAKYTFENFIEGDSNRFARAVCMQVAANPYTVYNPLFLYGPSGVGKTHLMSAVINEIKRTKPETRVLYTKGDDFINYMVECIKNNDMVSFRNRYRNCDVLLIDDIQFIAGKVATQNETFHTFQALFDEGKQIILASDRPPKDINPLEERLRSRFEQGLLADINPPDLELRVAIIKKRAEDIGIFVPNDVLSFLAENLRSNIRQIEGAIKKLAAKSLVDGRQISMELARDCIGDLLGDTEPIEVTIDKIFGVVYQKYGISKEEILGKKRNKEIVQARQVAITLVHHITEISTKRIGKIFSLDHSTVIYAMDVVKNRLITDPLFAADFEGLKKEVQGR